MLLRCLLLSITITLSASAFADETALVPLTAPEIKQIRKLFTKNHALQNDLLPVVRQFGIEDRVAKRSCSWLWTSFNQMLGNDVSSLSTIIPGLNLLQQDFFRTCVLQGFSESHFILKSLNPKIEDHQLQIVDTPPEFSAITQHVKIEPKEIQQGLAGIKYAAPLAISVTHFHYSDSFYSHTYEYEFSVELQDGRIFDFKGKRAQSSAKEDFIKLLRNVVENVSLLVNPEMLEAETLRLGQALKVLAIKYPKQASDFELLYDTLDPIYFSRRKANTTDSFMRVVTLETEVEEEISMDSGIQKSIDNMSLQESDRQLHFVFMNDADRTTDNPTAEEVFRFVLSQWDSKLHYQDELNATRKYIREVVSKHPEFYRALTLRRGGDAATSSDSSGSSGIGFGEIIIYAAVLNSLTHSSSGSGQ